MVLQEHVQDWLKEDLEMPSDTYYANSYKNTLYDSVGTQDNKWLLMDCSVYTP